MPDDFFSLYFPMFLNLANLIQSCIGCYRKKNAMELTEMVEKFEIIRFFDFSQLNFTAWCAVTCRSALLFVFGLSRIRHHVGNNNVPCIRFRRIYKRIRQEKCTEYLCGAIGHLS